MQQYEKLGLPKKTGKEESLIMTKLTQYILSSNVGCGKSLKGSLYAPPSTAFGCGQVAGRLTGSIRMFELLTGRRAGMAPEQVEDEAQLADALPAKIVPHFGQIAMLSPSRLFALLLWTVGYGKVIHLDSIRRLATTPFRAARLGTVQKVRIIVDANKLGPSVERRMTEGSSDQINADLGCLGRGK